MQREIVNRGARAREGGSDIDMCVDAVREMNQSPLFDELEASIQSCFNILHSEYDSKAGQRVLSPSALLQQQKQQLQQQQQQQGAPTDASSAVQPAPPAQSSPHTQS